MKKVVIKIYRIFVEWLKPKYGVVYSDDLPSSFRSNTIYLVGEKAEPWQAAFICPCGCSSLIQLSLLEDSRPRWEVHFDKSKINLYPSVHRKVGCRSHFFLRKGKIEWVSGARS